VRVSKVVAPTTQNDALAALQMRMQRLLRDQTSSRFRVEGDWALFAGCETRMPGDDYDFEGMKRGGDHTYPSLIWQYTLEGWGIYEQHGESHRVLPGQGFLAIVPSAHRYRMPLDSPSWTFFYLTLYHPYIAPRLAEQVKSFVPILTAPPETRLIARAASLFEACVSPAPRDNFAQEQMAFEWMFELERFIHALSYPEAERERWLEDVRLYVTDRLSRSLDIGELAASRGLSRSHFSHRFKAATGLSPAQWVQQIRLEEATHRLLSTDQKLETVARDTGLGNANQLCKIFRRRFHLSPGEFRRQMR
jgi:AraC-like DNA-binding protein